MIKLQQFENKDHQLREKLFAVFEGVRDDDDIMDKLGIFVIREPIKLCYKDETYITIRY